MSTTASGPVSPLSDATDVAPFDDFTAQLSSSSAQQRQSMEGDEAARPEGDFAALIRDASARFEMTTRSIRMNSQQRAASIDSGFGDDEQPPAHGRPVTAPFVPGPPPTVMEDSPRPRLPSHFRPPRARSGSLTGGSPFTPAQGARPAGAVGRRRDENGFAVTFMEDADDGEENDDDDNDDDDDDRGTESAAMGGGDWDVVPFDDLSEAADLDPGTSNADFLTTLMTERERTIAGSTNEKSATGLQVNTSFFRARKRSLSLKRSGSMASVASGSAHRPAPRVRAMSGADLRTQSSRRSSISSLGSEDFEVDGEAAAAEMQRLMLAARLAGVTAAENQVRSRLTDEAMLHTEYCGTRMMDVEFLEVAERLALWTSFESGIPTASSDRLSHPALEVELDDTELLEAEPASLTSRKPPSVSDGGDPLATPDKSTLDIHVPPRSAPSSDDPRPTTSDGGALLLGGSLRTDEDAKEDEDQTAGDDAQMDERRLAREESSTPTACSCNTQVALETSRGRPLPAPEEESAGHLVAGELCGEESTMRKSTAHAEDNARASILLEQTEGTSRWALAALGEAGRNVMYRSFLGENEAVLRAELAVCEAAARCNTLAAATVTPPTPIPVGQDDARDPAPPPAAVALRRLEVEETDTRRGCFSAATEEQFELMLQSTVSSATGPARKGVLHEERDARMGLVATGRHLSQLAFFFALPEDRQRSFTKACGKACKRELLQRGHLEAEESAAFDALEVAWYDATRNRGRRGRPGTHSQHSNRTHGGPPAVALPPPAQRVASPGGRRPPSATASTARAPAPPLSPPSLGRNLAPRTDRRRSMLHQQTTTTTIHRPAPPPAPLQLSPTNQGATDPAMSGSPHSGHPLLMPSPCGGVGTNSGGASARGSCFGSPRSFNGTASVFDSEYDLSTRPGSPTTAHSVIRRRLERALQSLDDVDAAHDTAGPTPSLDELRQQAHQSQLRQQERRQSRVSRHERREGQRRRLHQSVLDQRSESGTPATRSRRGSEASVRSTTSPSKKHHAGSEQRHGSGAPRRGSWTGVAFKRMSMSLESAIGDATPCGGSRPVTSPSYQDGAPRTGRRRSSTVVVVAPSDAAHLVRSPGRRRSSTVTAATPVLSLSPQPPPTGKPSARPSLACRAEPSPDALR